MQYVSTRNKDEKISSAEAIVRGIAPDGGLYCPLDTPKLDKEEIYALCKMDYKHRVAYVLHKFLDDFSLDELNEYAQKAYADEKFCGPDIAPLVKLKEDQYVLELFHGPTCAFKDMALQILPYLLTASLKKVGEKRDACILVATSGDTGKAALEGFCDVDKTKVVVYYPRDGVSDIQRLQMVTQKGKNVVVCAIDGNFDDAQSAVKSIFTDKAAVSKFMERGFILSSANSINWGRLAPQVAYYVSSYCDLLNRGEIEYGQSMNVAVPTGNFGNILAAYIAKRMGIFIHKLICASNQNNVLTEFLNTGVYNKNREFHVTTSPSMDILISSNLERLLFFASGMNCSVVKKLMDKLSKDGMYQISKELFDAIKQDFEGGFCPDKDTAAMIKNVFEQDNYLIDTHTAVALNVYQDYRRCSEDFTKTVIVSTASAYKFCADVLDSLGRSSIGDGIELLDSLCEYTKIDIPKPLLQIRDAPVRFKDVINKHDILKSIDKLI